MEKVLISVVVPVYNVEGYLSKCIDSILTQSYSCLEIILVDDGSNDSSGQICDEYAERDKRITVIHKTNNGLSRARNSGIEIASGKYIAFVDSDDFIHPLMLEWLINTAQEYDVPLVCCDYTSTEFPKEEKRRVELLDMQEAIGRLLDDTGYKCFAWNKIYEKSLFDGIRYPSGKLFEDIPTTYKLFKKTSKIAYCKNKLYFYSIRPGSISRYKFSGRDRDLLDAIDSILEAENSDGDMPNRLKLGYMSYYLFYVKKGISARADISEDYNRLHNFIKENFTTVLTADNISFRKRTQLALIGICPKLYKNMCIVLYSK